MGCIFGYCGGKKQGLMEGMSSILNHRQGQGFEYAVGSAGGMVAEIGRGIPARSGRSNIYIDKEQGVAFGHSGVLFKKGSTAAPHLDIAKSPEVKLANLEGAFAGVFVNADEVFLIRDHAGVKALYWTLHQGCLIFASEVKALFAGSHIEKKMRPEAVTQYLSFSFIPQEHTMFEDIFELQPGHMLRFKNGAVHVTRTFRFEEYEFDGEQQKTSSPKDAGTIDEYAASLRKTLEDSVDDCINVSGSPPGVFVSGGIDSSAVLALAAGRFPGQRLKTWSVHFGSKYPNENMYIEMITKMYNTDHTYLEIKPSQFAKRLRRIFWLLDDPIGDPVTAPNFLMSEAAGKECGIILNGEGGDPCFGGPKNIPMLMSLIYGATPGNNGRHLEDAYLHSYKRCFDDLERMLMPDFYKAAGGRDALYSILTPFFNGNGNGTPPLKSFMNRLMSMNIRLKGGNLILVKVDKMSSANGVLALPPLFSKNVIIESMACPPGFKMDGSIEKQALKKAVQDIVPRPIIERPKSGMMVPVKFWLRKELKRTAKKALSKKKIKDAGIFNPDYIENLLKYGRSEPTGARLGLKLWMLMTFTLWHETMGA